jgi:hypothetical protein
MPQGRVIPDARMRVALVLSIAVTGCMSYAPPIRTSSPGAPGRLGASEMEVGGAFGGFQIPSVGGPHLGYGIRDFVSIEAGGEFSPSGWAMGWLGPRFTLAPGRGYRLYPAADLELAGGAGVGGSGDDDRRWDHRFAGGGLIGGGFAYHVGRFAPYVRGRVQVTGAQGARPTAWTIANAGGQVRLADVVDLFADIGYARLDSSDGGLGGFAYRVGFAVFFRVLRR